MARTVDKRGRCRICGMTCDFSGQEYCRNCLKKMRKIDEQQRHLSNARERFHRDQKNISSEPMDRLNYCIEGIKCGLPAGVIAGFVLFSSLFKQ